LAPSGKSVVASGDRHARVAALLRVGWDEISRMNIH
jgi:hypothetical protein